MIVAITKFGTSAANGMIKLGCSAPGMRDFTVTFSATKTAMPSDAERELANMKEAVAREAARLAGIPVDAVMVLG